MRTALDVARRGEATRARYSPAYPETAVSETDWMRDGLCAELGGDFFFVEPHLPATEARSACAMCPVLETCREYAIADPELFGVWGGLTRAERQSVRSGRAAQARREAA